MTFMIYILSIKFYESITSATIEGKLLFNDGSGFVDFMTGSEFIQGFSAGAILDRVLS